MNRPSRTQGRLPTARQVASVLDEVGRLRVEARAVVEAILQGTHPSPNRGESVVFREHAEYLVGDDPRRIDWRASARRPRPVVKRFEQEARLTATLVLDFSSSMHFEGGGRSSKALYGALLTAATAELLIRQGDRFRLLLLGDAQIDYVDARGGRQQLDRLYAALHQSARQTLEDARANTSEDPDPGKALRERLSAIAQFIGRRRGLVICMSDFIPPADALLNWCGTLASIGHAVTALQLLSPTELQLPFDGPRRFVDPEARKEVTSDPRVSRASYLTSLDNWRKDLALRASQRNVAWTSASTEMLPAQVLRKIILRQGSL